MVLRERYLRRDENGSPMEDPQGLLRRVAAAIAQPAREFGEDVEFWEERFFRFLANLEFLPNSPTLMNAGLSGGQLAACFVLPVEDDLESIFRALGRMARLHQTGGGTGFSFSALRPREDHVHSTGGITSGPLSFMELFDHATAVIRRGGRRRGANMAVLRVDHPDIEDFVQAKRTPGRLENFNLSVGVTDEFFSALEADKPFELKSPRTGRVARTVNPAELLDEMVEAAWASGDPGLLFLDEINRHNPTPSLGAVEATNPCGEQPLLPHESCTLGSINLARFASPQGVDWERLRGMIHDAVVFLDNVIEANCYPFPEIEAASRRTRKIGLGIMGWADCLAGMGLPYDSEQALALGARVAGFITREARDASVRLGERRGSFPAFSSSVWPGRGFTSLRNAAVTCIAPTGTISLLAGTSSGIEPLFALAMVRRVLNGRRLVDVNPLVLATLDKLGLGNESLVQEIEVHGSMRRVAGLPEALRQRFPIALEIPPAFHVRMQAAFQAHLDAAVSKTVNLPSGASVEDVREVFLLARQLGLKGVTVYRYGSREDQALSLVRDAAGQVCRECAD